MSIEKEKEFNNIYTFEPILNESKRMKDGMSNDFFERLKCYNNNKSHRMKKLLNSKTPSLSRGATYLIHDFPF